MKTLFIANRGEIAARIIIGARQAGWRCVVAYPSIDAELPYVLTADDSLELAGPRDFLNATAMVKAALELGATAVHPGYGFLSENAAFAEACAEAGLLFVGPRPETIAALGDKDAARRLAISAGVPTLAHEAGIVATAEEACSEAELIGYPVMIKAVAGGGGMGMAVANDATELRAAFQSVTQRGQMVFGDDRVMLERYLARARHIEIQIMGLPNGEVVSFVERDCSVQRRHQKVVEESPSPAVSLSIRERARAMAETIGREAEYLNAGTVEFLLDLDSDEIYFLEVNARLQVEHPITEAVHGVDLVRWQLDVACGSSQRPAISESPICHAIELRVCAEDPQTFLPKPGRISRWLVPEGEHIRVDSGYVENTTVTPYFDSLLAKVVVTGDSRDEALERAIAAVAAIEIEGPGTNLELLTRVLTDPSFRSGSYNTGIVGQLSTVSSAS